MIKPAGETMGDGVDWVPGLSAEGDAAGAISEDGLVFVGGVEVVSGEISGAGERLSMETCR